MPLTGVEACEAPSLDKDESEDKSQLEEAKEGARQPEERGKKRVSFNSEESIRFFQPEEREDEKPGKMSTRSSAKAEEKQNESQEIQMEAPPVRERSKRSVKPTVKVLENRLLKAAILGESSSPGESGKKRADEASKDSEKKKGISPILKKKSLEDEVSPKEMEKKKGESPNLKENSEGGEETPKGSSGKKKSGSTPSPVDSKKKKAEETPKKGSNKENISKLRGNAPLKGRSPSGRKLSESPENTARVPSVSEDLSKVSSTRKKSQDLLQDKSKKSPKSAEGKLKKSPARSQSASPEDPKEKSKKSAKSSPRNQSGSPEDPSKEKSKKSAKSSPRNQSASPEDPSEEKSKRSTKSSTRNQSASPEDPSKEKSKKSTKSSARNQSASPEDPSKEKSKKSTKSSARNQSASPEDSKEKSKKSPNAKKSLKRSVSPEYPPLEEILDEPPQLSFEGKSRKRSVSIEYPPQDLEDDSAKKSRKDSSSPEEKRSPVNMRRTRSVSPEYLPPDLEKYSPNQKKTPPKKQPLSVPAGKSTRSGKASPKQSSPPVTKKSPEQRKKSDMKSPSKVIKSSPKAKTETTNASKRSPSPVKEHLGKRSLTEELENSDGEVAEDSDAQSSEEEASLKRGRGRPRKCPVPEASEDGNAEAGEGTSPKRGRGRPRKSPVLEASVSGSSEAQSSPEASDEATAKRKRGRRPKISPPDERATKKPKQEEPTADALTLPDTETSHVSGSASPSVFRSSVRSSVSNSPASAVSEVPEKGVSPSEVDQAMELGDDEDFPSDAEILSMMRFSLSACTNDARKITVRMVDGKWIEEEEPCGTLNSCPTSR